MSVMSVAVATVAKLAAKESLLMALGFRFKRFERLSCFYGRLNTVVSAGRIGLEASCRRGWRCCQKQNGCG
ncbi:MAG: hypothetical protein AAF268_03485 [Cyanobacteria bacterium P01_A01_bin.3]